MDRTRFQILSEQQMALAQQKAHSLLVRVKEDVQWSKYCGDNIEQVEPRIANPIHYVADQNLPVNKPTETKKDISIQVTLDNTLPTIPQKESSSREDQSRPEVFSRLYPTRPFKHSNVVTDSLQEIKQKIVNLQLNIGALKENKISGRNAASNKPFSSLQELKNSGILLDSFKSTIPKQIGFQVPYILQEQRALENRRRQSLMKQASAYQSYEKRNTFKTETRPSRSQGFSPSGNKSKRYDIKEKRPEATKMGQPARATRSKYVKRLVKKNAVVSQSVGKDKTENGNASILSLKNKLAEIEEREKQLEETLKSVAVKTPFIELEKIPMEITELHNTSEAYARIRNSESETYEDQEKCFIETCPRKTDERFSENTRKMKNKPHRTELYIQPSVLKSIHTYKKDFDKSSSFITSSGRNHFNPFTLCEKIADSILEDCFQDVAEEMENIFSSLVMDLYNEEFRQS